MAPPVRKFTFPLQRKELLSGSKNGQFFVENEYSIRELKTKLKDTQVLVKQKGSQFVLESGGFDVIFSVLELFHKELPTEFKTAAFDILVKATDHLIREIDVFSCGPNAGNDTEKSTLATKMKMIVYLLSQLVELIEADVLQKDSAASAVASKGKKKKNEDSDFGNWDEMRYEMLTLIFRLLSQNINGLFDPPIVEEEVINAIGNCIFRIYENPSIALQRLKDVRTSLTQVLGVMMSKYGYSLSCRLKIVQSLKHFEHLAAPLAEAVEKLATDFQCRSLVMDVVREITRLDSKELSRDTSGTRAFSQFLVELSERVPDQLQPCLSLLQLHLDGDSYMLRKSILSIFMEIVLRLFSSENLDEAGKETRDQYLDCLEDHVHDVHAHVRSSVLHSWAKLCTSKAIPLNRQNRILKLAVGRLKDRSSNVRKQAVQLLTFLLQCNPYNSSLPVEEIREQYEKEKAVLDDMSPKNKSEEEGQKLAEEKAAQWAAIEKELENYADQQDAEDKLWENASPGEVHERIRHHLIHFKFGQAISLLSQAKNEFPIFKKLESEENDDINHQLRAIFFMPLFREMATAEAEEKADNEEMSDELKRQHFMVDYLKDSLTFAATLNEALPVICTLLGSKQISDVQEAINFFVAAFEFGLLNAMIGVRKMLSLIFSRESNVQAAVVAAYKRLYIESASNENGDKTNAVQLVRNLTALVSGATIGDLAGLEELIGMLVKSKDLDKNCFQVMWQMFTKVMPETSDDQSRCALTLLGMVGNIEPNILTTNINVLVEHGFKGDLKTAHDACLALTKISSKGSTPDAPPFRLDSDHELFEKLQLLLVEAIDNVKDDQYMPLAQQAITVIYALSDTPDQIAADISKRLAAKVAAQPKNSVLLRRTFFVVGHVAVCQLNYLDCSVFGELKRRNALREMKKEKEKVKAKSKTKRRASAMHENSPRIRASIGSNAGAADEEDEVVGAEADDAEAEYIRSVCEKEIVNAPGNLLTSFAPSIIEVCLYPHKYPDAKLRAAASLALAKFMLVSSEFCEEQLQLLFTVLERSAEPVIRANMIIAAGDLSFRFPNTLEPWTPRMYACLRDESALVRSNTVTVLTHLILNDMIKVKGQISDMALCIMDDNEKISNMAKLFFTELSRKGNKLYNVMPDIVSRLSDPAADIDEGKFKEIMRYIIGLIDKDKHSESLVEKLCHRFHATTTPRQWRDIGFCLSIFNYNDKACKKFIDNLNCFADKLHDDCLYEAVLAILTQCKKLPKAETKLAIEEMAAKVEEARQKCVEDHGAGNRAKEAKVAGKNEHKGKRGKKAKESSSSDEDADFEEPSRIVQPRKSLRPSVVSSKKRVVVEDSSDDEPEESAPKMRTAAAENDGGKVAHDASADIDDADVKGRRPRRGKNKSGRHSRNEDTDAADDADEEIMDENKDESNRRSSKRSSKTSSDSSVSPVKRSTRPRRGVKN